MTAVLAISHDYAELLKQTLPKVIHSEEQNDKYLAILEDWERRSDSLTEAEGELAELLTFLIESFEEKSYKLRPITPFELLQELMEANDLKQKDLADVFGTASVVSEVLNGKREINKEHIRKLSERFNVSPELFF